MDGKIPHNVARLLLGQCHDGGEIVKEFTIFAQFKHQKDKGIRLKDILQFNDVRMPHHLAQNGDFLSCGVQHLMS